MNVIRILIVVVLLWGVNGCIKEDGQPTANAGPDKVIFAGDDTQVVLSGEASFDPNGDLLTHHWSIENMPQGSSAILSAYTGPEVTLNIDEFGIYKIGLIVDDGVSSSRKDIVVIEYLSAPKNTGSDGEDGSIVFSHNNVVGESCALCHNGISTMGKPADHLMSSDICQACHATTSWIPALYVNHTDVVGICVDCHNGLLAVGKPENHAPASDACDECHLTNDWLNAGYANGGSIFNHAAIIDDCASCHNGIEASGQPASHIAATKICESCHSVDTWVSVADLDHSQVIGECIDCHNGTLSVGKPPSHLATTDKCDSCHNIEQFVPVAAVDHTEVLGSCETCHSPPAEHMAAGVTASCADCHSTIKWPGPTSPLPSPTTINGS